MVRLNFFFRWYNRRSSIARTYPPSTQPPKPQSPQRSTIPKPSTRIQHPREKALRTTTIPLHHPLSSSSTPTNHLSHPEPQNAFPPRSHLPRSSNLSLSIWIQHQTFDSKHIPNLRFEVDNPVMEAHPLHARDLKADKTALDDVPIVLITSPPVLIRVHGDEEIALGTSSVLKRGCRRCGMWFSKGAPSRIDVCWLGKAECVSAW